MNYQKFTIKTAATIIILSLSGLSAHAAETDDSVLSQAQACTKVSERLARLACFDHAFDTPIYSETDSDKPRDVPFSWHQAMDSYAATQPGEVAHLNLQGVGESSNAWLTIAATNPAERFKDTNRPVLMMSCIDRISRLELALPQEFPNARAKVSFVSGDTKYWRSDDSGYVLSAGRGIPAIVQMKNMMKEKTITLHSNDKTIDGLVFNTESLRDDLRPLRERCDW